MPTILRQIEHWLSYATEYKEDGASFHTVQSELATPYMSLKRSTILTDILQLQVVRLVPRKTTRES